jgi:site-specific DNA recombinase
MTEPVRCAIYARYSSELQSEHSIEDQVRECRKFIDRQGWVVADGHVYDDRAISGTCVSRSGYQAMKAAAKPENFNCIVVHDLSRLGRDHLESVSIFHQLRALDVRLVGVADGLDTANHNAKPLYYMRSVFAEMFVDDMRDKVLRGQEGKCRNNYSPGGRVYGYRFDRIIDPSGAKDGRGYDRVLGTEISKDPHQAEVVHRIFQMRAQGMGYRAISKQLNSEGTPSPRFALKGHGDPTWSLGTLVTIVKQKKYRGCWIWNENEYRRVPGQRKKRRIPKPKSEWVVVQREDLRIVSDELWEKAQADPCKYPKLHPFKRPRNLDHPELDGRGKFLLSGLLKCAVCGSNLIAMSSKKESAFVCNRHWSRGSTACPNKLRVRRALAEEVLLHEIKQHFLDPKVVTRLAREMKAKLDAMPKPEPKELQEREAIKAELNSQITNLTQFVMTGDTSDAIRAALSEKEQELKRVHHEIDALTARQKANAPDVSEEWVASKLSGIRELFNSRPDKIPLIRLELRHLLDGQILMTPTGEGKGRHYVATVRGKPLAILGEIPGVSQVSSPTGNRTPVWWLRTTRPNP